MRISDWSSDVCSSDLSWQYRMMEFMLGGRNPDMIALHDYTPQIARSLREEAARPSLYDEAIRLPARRGFAIEPAVTERDLTAPYAHSNSVEAVWAALYRAPKSHWNISVLVEKTG